MIPVIYGSNYLLNGTPKGKADAADSWHLEPSANVSKGSAMEATAALNGAETAVIKPHSKR